jgi:hypothetical protein
LPAPLLANGFGLRDGFFQRSDLGFQGPNRPAFVRARAVARGIPLRFQIGKDASLEGVGEIWIGQRAVPLRVT